MLNRPKKHVIFAVSILCKIIRNKKLNVIGINADTVTPIFAKSVLNDPTKSRLAFVRVAIGWIINILGWFIIDRFQNSRFKFFCFVRTNIPDKIKHVI